MNKEIITSIDPKSPVSEVFRTLRTNLQYLNKRDGAQTILLTSTVQGEGKSFVASNLAVTFAQAGKKVVLVDSDMRRPRQHKLFKTNMYPGLSNYLVGVDIYRDSHEVTIDECVYKTEVENLSILPAGNIPPNPAELLQGEKLGELIEELKEKYDIVIVDGAPCLIVTDATLVSRLVDATILVCSQRKTKIEDLKEARTRIKRVGGKIAGVVLNRIKVSNRKYGEKYYYYSNAEAEAEYDLDERNRSSKDEYEYVKDRYNDHDDYEEIREEYEEEVVDDVNESNEVIEQEEVIEESYVDENESNSEYENENDNNVYDEEIEKVEDDYVEEQEEIPQEETTKEEPKTVEEKRDYSKDYSRKKKRNKKKRRYDKNQSNKNEGEKQKSNGKKHELGYTKKSNAEKIQEILAEINKVKED